MCTIYECTCKDVPLTVEQEQALRDEAKRIYFANTKKTETTLEIIYQILKGLDVVEIAKNIGVSRSRVYQAYNQYFEDKEV